MGKIAVVLNAVRVGDLHLADVVNDGICPSANSGIQREFADIYQGLQTKPQITFGPERAKRSIGIDKAVGGQRGSVRGTSSAHVAGYEQPCYGLPCIITRTHETAC